MLGLDYRHRAPAYQLVVDGVDITPRVNGRLISLTLTDNRGEEADMLDLQLADHDGLLALPRKGAEIQLALGWAGEPLIDKGTFTVDEIEHSGSPDVVGIRARSADMREQLPAPRTRSWHRTTIGEMVAAIAEEHGLEPRVAERLRGIRVAHIDQTSESDISFLTRLAKNHDAIATVKAGRLLFMPKGVSETVSGRPLPAVTIQRSDGDQHRYSVADRNAYTGVRAYWNNVSGGRRQMVVAGDGDNAKELPATYASEDDAAAAARAELQRLQRGAAEFSLTLVRGRPELMPETPLKVRGFKPEIDAQLWIVTRVTHALGDGGFTTSVECEVANTG